MVVSDLVQFDEKQLVTLFVSTDITWLLLKKIQRKWRFLLKTARRRVFVKRLDYYSVFQVHPLRPEQMPFDLFGIRNQVFSPWKYQFLRPRRRLEFNQQFQNLVYDTQWPRGQTTAESLSSPVPMWGLHRPTMEYNLLEKNNYKTLKPHTLKGLCLPAKVVDIYDGDTPWVVFYQQNVPQLRRFRMAGYNSPEMKPLLVAPYRDLHKQAALVAKDKLGNLLDAHTSERVVWIKFDREDKYGRALGDMYIPNKAEPDVWHGDELSVNKWMVANDYGKPYFGGRKTSWTKDELQTIVDKQYASVEGLLPGMVSDSDQSLCDAFADTLVLGDGAVVEGNEEKVA